FPISIPPPPRSTLFPTRRSSDLHITVADTGRGIPEAHLPHVFDRFYRVDAARSPATGGVGLGLAIVRTIVSLHGGSVALQSVVRSEEHTSELQSPDHLVCRLLLE